MVVHENACGVEPLYYVRIMLSDGLWAKTDVVRVMLCCVHADLVWMLQLPYYWEGPASRIRRRFMFLCYYVCFPSFIAGFHIL